MAERKKKKTPNSVPYAQIENVPSANIYEETYQGDNGTPSIGSQSTTPLHTYNDNNTTTTKRIPKLKIHGYNNPGIQIPSSSPQDATPDTTLDINTPSDINTYAANKVHSKQVSFKLPVNNNNNIEETKEEIPFSSVTQILDDLERATSIGSQVPQDPEFDAMQEMMKHQSSTSIVLNDEDIINSSPQMKYVPRVSIASKTQKDKSFDESILSEYRFDDANNNNDINKLRSKYRQLKDKYIRLHKNYKKTKNLRLNNEKLLVINRENINQITDLTHRVNEQKHTIISQNKHLLKLRSERDDFADVVEEQLQEKRITEKYGVSPLTFSEKEMNNNNESIHIRSITTPLQNVTRKSVITAADENNNINDINDMNFDEDSKFTIDYQKSIDGDDMDDDDDDDDDEDDEEEKYVTHVIQNTPGGPVNNNNSKKTRFVEVDDITRDVERKYYSQSRSVLTSEINPHKVSQLWCKIIGETTDDINIVEQSSEICDAWNISECECVERIIFILKYYSQWLNHRATITKRKSRATRDVFNQLPNVPEIENEARKEGYCESMSEFINNNKILKYYNHVQLLNDFFHIKKFHIDNNEFSNNDNANSESVFKYFVNEFGFCDVKHCICFRRNHREKSFFGHHNRFRRKIYHLNKNKFNDLNEYNPSQDDTSYELHEINIQQCLDMIHSTLIHNYHNTTTDNLTEFTKQLLKSPIQLMDDDDNNEVSAVSGTTTHTGLTPHHGPINNNNNNTKFEYKQVINSVSGTRTGARVSVIDSNRIDRLNININAAQQQSHPSTPIPLSPQQEDVTSLTQDVFSYGFGVRFSYWMREWPDFVQPKFSTLRDELLENDIYRISKFEWDLLQHRSAIFMQTNHGIFEYLAKFKGSGNKLMKISMNERLSINHLIALYTYTNYPNIRISFQKACLRTTSNETFMSVLKRHEQIANWARLLYESVYLFGERMKYNTKFYHILRSKIMLSKFSANLSCPTTMIANKKIVNNSNIVMEVENAHSRGTTFLDISYFSDVPNKQEKLFFFGDLAIENIILRGKSYRHYIKSLSLFQKIVQGSYFYHTSLKKKEYQQTIIDFMDNLCASNDAGGISNYVQMLRDRKKYNDEDIIIPNQIPLYMQHLFDYFCSKLKTLWINQEEFQKLLPKLQLYLVQKNYISNLNHLTNISNLLLLTNKNKQSLMGKFTKFLHFQYSINLKYCCTLHWEISGTPLKNFTKGQKIFGQEFRVSTIRLFPYIVKDSSKNDGQFRFGIPIKSMPKYLKKIEFRVDLYIPEINYTFSAYSIIDERGTYWYSLFDSSKLYNFNKFTLKISFRLINLMVSNGNTITQPSMTNRNTSSAQPRGHTLSVFKLENFRKVSGTNLENVTKRISKKFQRNKNAIIN